MFCVVNIIFSHQTYISSIGPSGANWGQSFFYLHFIQHVKNLNHFEKFLPKVK